MKYFQSIARVCSSLLVTAFVCVMPQHALARSKALTFSCHQGPTDVQTKLLESWIAEVEKQTDKKVTFDFYPGQSLIPASQTYDGIVSGMVDMGFSILQYTRGRFPLMDFINLPLGFQSGQVNTAIINEVVDKFNPKELQEAKLLYLSAHGPGLIHTTSREVTKLEDLKGLKIRSNGPTADMIKLLGATPSALPIPELYQALQKGVVQGGIWDFSASVDWKLAEVSKYSIVSHTTPYSIGFFVIMNKDVWDGLDPEVQKVMEEISPLWAAKHGKAWDESDIRGIAAEEAAGNKIVKLTPEEDARWEKAVEPVINAYIENCEKKGLPGKEVIAYVRQRLKDADEGNFESKYMLK